MGKGNQVFKLGKRDIEAFRWAMRIALRDKERRPLNGILFDPRGRIVSTDSHRMLIWRTSALDGLGSRFVAGPVRDDVEVPPAERGALTVSSSEVVLDCGIGGVFRLPVMREEYVDYEAVLPDRCRLAVRVRTSALGGMIDNALTELGEPDGPVGRQVLLDRVELTLYLQEGTLSLAARRETHDPTAPGEWVFDESVEVEWEGEAEEEEDEFRVGVNGHFLSDAVRSLQPADDDVVLIRFVDERQPIVLSCEGNEDTRHVMAPVRLDQPEESFEEDVMSEEAQPYRRAWASSRRPRRMRDTRIGRNAPCPCGSGKKYKKCCLGTPNDPALLTSEFK